MEMFSIWKRCLNNQNRMLERLLDRFNEKIYGGKRISGLNPMQIVFSGADIARVSGDRYVNKNNEVCYF